jgi:sortase A
VPLRKTKDDNIAADLVRQKVARVFDEEPDVIEEIQEAVSVKNPSKHQQYMEELGKSGYDLATIQTKWHEYYSGLSEEERLQVWQEFYDSQDAVMKQQEKDAKSKQKLAANKSQVITSPRTKAKALKDSRSPKEIQEAIKDKVTASGRISAKQNLQSLLFGLGVGAVVIIIFLFSFFNEVVIAPFIQPSRADASTPIILSTDSISPTSEPEVIIPKINVQIPANYSETSTSESVIENDLEDGVVHYPTTTLPGQDGNTAFFGHSSNNIFNPGKYKFAFVLLHTLVNGDTFYLTYNNKVYVYKVISHTIVPPSDVSVLNPVQGQTATATLITCDPPGTSINRLIVVGQQISPDPSTNTAGAVATTAAVSKALPGNGPTLLSRVLHSVIGKLVAVIVVLGLIYFSVKKLLVTWDK